MERKGAIRSAYRLTGGNNFYDGMITCSKQNIHRWDTALCKCLWLPVLGKMLLFFLLGCWLGFCRFI